jgi:site-specific DNA recombinase
MKTEYNEIISNLEKEMGNVEDDKGNIEYLTMRWSTVSIW